MYEPKLEKDIRCPMDYGLSIIGGKWKPRILSLLEKKGTLRYSAIRDNLTDITDSVLATALQELIQDDMVERQQFNEVPLRVEYCLTEKGLSMIPILQSLCEWATPHCGTAYDKLLPQCQNCTYFPKSSRCNEEAKLSTPPPNKISNFST